MDLMVSPNKYDYRIHTLIYRILVHFTFFFQIVRFWSSYALEKPELCSRPVVSPACSPSSGTTRASFTKTRCTPPCRSSQGRCQPKSRLIVQLFKNVFLFAFQTVHQSRTVGREPPVQRGVPQRPPPPRGLCRGRRRRPQVFRLSRRPLHQEERRPSAADGARAHEGAS